MKNLFLTLFVALALPLFSADPPKYSLAYYGSKEKYEITTIGVGLGLDYGGIGVNLTHYPHKNVGFFAGVGYVDGISGNVGGKVRLIFVEKGFSTKPFAMALFGHNAVITYRGPYGGQIREAFWGPSFGLGSDFGVLDSKINLSVAAIFPVRAEEANQRGTYYPVLLSLGLKFRVDK